MKKIEILAPAGSFECVKAAINNGADAIYLGLKELNARKNASNFDEIELEQTIKYCHLCGAKVYLTLNILIFDREFSILNKVMDIACKFGIDAVIVQDLGVLKAVQEICPEMPIHCSTQMAVHNLKGVEFLQKLGASRVVLARELSFDEIKNITDNSDIEIEVFVHGALCMSVSGQCYMSAMIGSRSGNRGQCAQPCRLPHSVNEKNSFALSLKDLSSIENINKLIELGITSLKIEGRMKRPEYVASAVKSCYQALNQQKPDLEELQAVFSRSGFTNGYLESKLGKDMFGIREKKDVVSANSVLKKLENTYKNQLGRVEVGLKFVLKNNENVYLEMKDNDGNIVNSIGDIPQKAISKPTTIEIAKKSLEKLGGTPFFCDDINIEIEDGLMVSVSVLNTLRRDCCERLQQKREQIKPYDYKLINIQNHKIIPKKDGQELRCRFKKYSQIPFNLINKIDKIILPINEIIENDLKDIKNKIIIELPRMIFKNQNSYIEKLQKLKRQGINKILALNIAHIEIAKRLDLEIYGGFSLNITNSMSISLFNQSKLKDLTVSIELNINDLSRLNSKTPLGCIIYGHIPLMIVRNCPIKNYKICSECDEKSFLIDRKNNNMPVVCDKITSEILNPMPVYMLDRLDEISFVDFFVLYFTIEDEKICENIINAYFEKTNILDKYSRGLFYKGVL